MRAFNQHSGTAAALRRENVDTDIIIPMVVCVTVPRDELGDYAFQQIRFLPDGSEDPEFILNKGPFRDTSILIGGSNFGCGSSREWAVYAIQEFGIRVVIAPSFGDIFFANCIKNGILPIQLEDSVVRHLMDVADHIGGTGPLHVDLEARTITVPDEAPIPFKIDAGYRNRLLQGRDEISITLDHADDIRSAQNTLRAAQPWLFESGH